MSRFYVFLVAAVLLLGGCGREQQPASKEKSSAVIDQKADTRRTIVAFGDSLTAGHGVDPGQSYPDYLQAELDRRGYPYRVVNAGISGDTTSGGLDRVSEVLEQRPEIVILELGANDGLRGIPVASSQENLEEIITALNRGGTKILLAGMTLPPNYGPQYIRSFERMFTMLAAEHRLRLIPFLLTGVAGTTTYMQSDGLHPNAEGCRLVARTVFQALEPLLTK